MIVITGATGALNGATVEHLLTLVPATDVGVCVRDVAKAQSLADRGVRVRQGSYEDPAGLRHAFEGAEQVLLVSSNDPGADAVSLHRVGIEAAVDAGAARILYTSHQGAGHESPFPPAAVHAATEDLLAGSGVAWTSLRNGFYAHSLDWLLGPWQDGDTIATPADGPVSWTARSDEAEAAAVILAGRTFDGPVTLTASEAVTFEDVAGLLTGLTGRPVGRRVVDDQQWLSDGGDEARRGFMLTFFLAARAGLFAGTSPVLADLLGREPQTVSDLLADRVGAR